MALRKIIILIIFIPVITQAQIFKGVGAHLGWTIKGYGWNNPDPVLNKLYPSGGSVDEPWLGVYGEFFSKKYYSTMLEAAFRGTNFKFDYNTLDDHGNITGTETVVNTTNIFCFSVSEKLKYDIHSWSFYATNGLKYSFQTSKDSDVDFQNIINNLKTNSFGYIGGLGTAKAFGKFRMSLDILYETDFNKIYSSASGYVRKSGISFRAGFGYYIEKGDSK